jgi:pimeloyl-ACP methyl ester carboxylesterase
MKSEKTAVSSDGVVVSYDVEGRGKPALVFIHGWSNNRGLWDGQVAVFSNKYKTVTIDLPGFGQSGDNRMNWTIDLFGDDVAAVINKLDLEKTILVGFSMGGAVAIEAANKLPDKVAGIVLVDNLQNVGIKYPLHVISYMDSLFWDIANNPNNEKLVEGGFYKNNQEESFRKVLKMLDDSSKTGWRESLNNYIRWINEDLIEQLNKLQVPVKAINSELEPTDEDAFRKYVPHSMRELLRVLVI